MINSVGTKLKITNFSWKQNSSNSRFEPYVELLDSSDQSLKKVILPGYIFGWELSEDRTCPGFGLYGSFTLCSNENQLNTETDTMCSVCESKQGFKDAFFFNKEPNQKIKKYLEQTHFVYLAFFPPNRIKVGTASNFRKLLRLIEQDAGAFAFISEVSDAYAARDLEKRISSNTNIPESMGNVSKFNSMSAKVNLEYCKKMLKSVYSEIKSKGLTSEIVKNPELVSISDLTDIFYPDRKVDLTRENILSGKFVGLRGRYLILENNEKLFAWDTRTLIGRKIIGYPENYFYDIHESEQLELI